MLHSLMSSVKFVGHQNVLGSVNVQKGYLRVHNLVIWKYLLFRATILHLLEVGENLAKEGRQRMCSVTQCTFIMGGIEESPVTCT